MSDRMPDQGTECLPDRMPEDLPDRMPVRMSEDMPEDMPDRVPEDMTEHIAEDMPGRMPEDMQDRMPEDLPERMPEDMSDRMPVTKRINVMVGITRSKVTVTSHTRSTVNYRGVGGSVVRRSRSAYITFGYHRRPSGQHTGVEAGARIDTQLLCQAAPKHRRQAWVLGSCCNAWQNEWWPNPKKFENPTAD